MTWLQFWLLHSSVLQNLILFLAMMLALWFLSVTWKQKEWFNRGIVFIIICLSGYILRQLVFNALNRSDIPRDVWLLPSLAFSAPVLWLTAIAPIVFWLIITKTDKGKSVLFRAGKTTQQLVNELNETKAQNTALENFNRVLAHDLRSPLRNLNGYAALLDKKYSDLLDDKAKSYLGHLIVSSQQMSDRIDKAEYYSKLGNELIIDPDDPVFLSKAAELAAGHLREKVTQSKAQINIQTNMPAVNGDWSLLVQVFQNLIDNAIKYNDKAKPIVDIYYQDGKVHIADNGQGLDEAYRSRVFELFHQLNPESEGSGVGLSNCKRIIEKHGGIISFRSDGNGTKFYFTTGT